jgi:hypothetical protein
VQVPFGAPPGERDRRRLWIGLGVGGALLAVCCVGGIFGFGALVVQTGRGLINEATTVVGDYLDALRGNDYQRAYNLLCADLRSQTPINQYANEQFAKSPVRSYSLGEPRAQGSTIWVQAEVIRDDGPETDDFGLVREGTGSAALRICEIRQ